MGIIKTVVIVAGLLLLSVMVIILINQIRINRRNSRYVDELLEQANASSSGRFKADDVEGLPAPVKRYLNTVIPEDQPYAESVRLEQSGKFRIGGLDSPWSDMTATQHFTVAPPGFVWDAKIRMFPLMNVRVVDMYKSGEGSLNAKLLSTITVADQKPEPEVNSGELMRYLAESVWFPTALLPDQGVMWTAVSDEEARATIEYGDTMASLIFHSNEQNLVDRVFSDQRYREVEGEFEPTSWTGFFSNYQEKNGMLIPLDGMVQWNLEKGNLTYWKGHVDEIIHEPVD